MKTIGRRVVGREVDDWRNSNSEEMHLESSIWDRLQVSCLLDGHPSREVK